MASKKDIKIGYLREMVKGDIVPFTDIAPENVATLRTLCGRLKNSGYRFEVKYKPDLKMAIVRRKSSGEV